jgi:hypothetical protein
MRGVVALADAEGSFATLRPGAEDGGGYRWDPLDD